MKFRPVLERFLRVLNSADFLPALLTRIVIASVFVGSGWGKLTHLEKTIEFFRSLGVPFGAQQAPVIALIEFAGGLLILLGLLSRLAAVPLIGIMAVAIRTAKWEEVTGWSSLIELSEFLYAVLLIWLLFVGPGRASLDHLLWSKSKQNGTLP